MKKITSFLLFLSLVTLLFSCNNSNDVPGYTEGVVRFTSELSTGGCGYVVDMNGGTYIPTNLDSKYQVNNLVIFIQYQLTNQRINCKDAANGLDQISILSIRGK